MYRKTILYLTFVLSFAVLQATPRERTRVKYRIKTGLGKRVVDKAVAEVVEMPLQSGEALNGVEGSSLPLKKRQVVGTVDLAGVVEPGRLNLDPARIILDRASLSRNEALLEQELEEEIDVAQRREDFAQSELEDERNPENFQKSVSQIIGEYSESVAEITQGIQRAARFNERSVGDIIFDVAKEVVAEVVGGALTRIFGIGTARQGGANIMEIVLGAITNSGRPKSC